MGSTRLLSNFKFIIGPVIQHAIVVKIFPLENSTVALYCDRIYWPASYNMICEELIEVVTCGS